jgi:hypothetical protein
MLRLKKDRKAHGIALVAILVVVLLAAVAIMAFYVVAYDPNLPENAPGEDPIIGYILVTGAVVVDNGQVLGGTYIGMRDWQAHLENAPPAGEFVMPGESMYKATKVWFVKISIASAAMGNGYVYHYTTVQQRSDVAGGSVSPPIAFSNMDKELGVRAHGTYHITIELWDTGPDTLTETQNFNLVV